MRQINHSRGSVWQLLAFTLGMFLLTAVGFFGYLYFFTNQLPLFGPAMSTWQVQPGFAGVADGKTTWTVVYENAPASTYQATVRSASRIHMSAFPMLTHDILVTSGDYADPNLVDARVDVFQHHFYWSARTSKTPSGYIHLLHTVPYNEEIYQKLLRVQTGDQVTISGREIDRINAFDQQAKRDLGYWTDTGCNTLLVTAVEWKK